MPDKTSKAPAIPPRGPCAFALGAMGVPARRWSTRTDLYEQLLEAKTYIERAPLETASAANAARTAGLSLYHFSRLFKEVHGETPHQMLLARRVNVARRMLIETQLPIIEIACAVGYESQSAFGRVFRAQVGLSPTQFRLAKSST